MLDIGGSLEVRCDREGKVDCEYVFSEDTPINMRVNISLIEQERPVTIIGCW